jgi:hypothetical protein
MTDFATPSFAATRAEFAKIVGDMIADMTLTFPDYAAKWEPWSIERLDSGTHREYVDKIDALFMHCRTICMLNVDFIQNTDDALFAEPNRAEFLPGVDFGILYNCVGIGAATKEAFWRYIQLILVLVEREQSTEVLHTSIADAAEELHAMFLNRAEDREDTPRKNTTPEPELADQAKEATPPTGLDPKFLDGKLGRIAQSIAGQLGGDFADLAGDLSANPGDIAGFMARLMRNPAKISALVKTVSGKLTEQVGNGNITTDELMAETSQFMSQMGGAGFGGSGDGAMPGGANFGDILGGLMQTMGAGGGLREDGESKRNKLTWKEKVKLRTEKKRAAANSMGNLPALSDEMLISAFEDIKPAKKAGTKSGK